MSILWKAIKQTKLQYFAVGMLHSIAGFGQISNAVCYTNSEQLASIESQFYNEYLQTTEYTRLDTSRWGLIPGVIVAASTCQNFDTLINQLSRDKNISIISTDFFNSGRNDSMPKILIKSKHNEINELFRLRMTYPDIACASPFNFNRTEREVYRPHGEDVSMYMSDNSKPNIVVFKIPDLCSPSFKLTPQNIYSVIDNIFSDLEISYKPTTTLADETYVSYDILGKHISTSNKNYWEWYQAIFIMTLVNNQKIDRVSILITFKGGAMSEDDIPPVPGRFKSNAEIENSCEQNVLNKVVIALQKRCSKIEKFSDGRARSLQKK